MGRWVERCEVRRDGEDVAAWFHVSSASIYFHLEMSGEDGAVVYDVWDAGQ